MHIAGDVHVFLQRRAQQRDNLYEKQLREDGQRLRWRPLPLDSLINPDGKHHERVEDLWLDAPERLLHGKQGKTRVARGQKNKLSVHSACH